MGFEVVFSVGCEKRISMGLKSLPYKEKKQTLFGSDTFYLYKSSKVVSFWHSNYIPHDYLYFKFCQQKETQLNSLFCMSYVSYFEC